MRSTSHPLEVEVDRTKIVVTLRLTHRPSGGVGYSADERDQGRNRRVAFRRLAESAAFRAWIRLIAAEIITGKTIEQRVEDEMASEKLKVEVRGEDGRWRAVDSGDYLDEQ